MATIYSDYSRARLGFIFGFSGWQVSVVALTFLPIAGAVSAGAWRWVALFGLLWLAISALTLTPVRGRSAVGWLQAALAFAAYLVKAVMAADPTLHELALRAQRLVRLQSALRALLPPQAPAVVSGLDADGLLQVQVDNPAWANRLRQSAPSLAARLAAQGLPVTSVRLRTRSASRRSGAGRSTRSPSSTSPRARSGGTCPSPGTVGPCSGRSRRPGACRRVGCRRNRRRRRATAARMS